MEHKEINNPKIITKKTYKMRWIAFRFITDFGKTEIMISIFSILFIALSFSLLTRINQVLGFVLGFIIFIISVLLMADDKNGNKVYWKIFTAFKFLFVNKKVSNLIEYIPVLDKKENIVFYKDKIGIFYKIISKDLTLNIQSERNVPIQKLSKILKLLNMEFEIVKVEVPYNFEKQLNYLTTLKQTYKEIPKLNQLASYENELTDFENSVNLKNNFYLIVYGKDNKTLSNQLKFVLNEFDSDISFKKISSQEVSFILEKLIIPNNFGVNSKPETLKQHKKFIKINDKYVSYLTIQSFPLLVNDGWMMNMANLSNVNVNIKFKDISNLEALKMLDTAKKRAELLEFKTASEENKNSSYNEQILTLLNLVQNGGESLKLVSIIFTVFGDNKKELNHFKDILKTEMLKNNFTLNELEYLQLNTYNFIWNLKTSNLASYWQEMATISIASSWPFMGEALNDDKGLYLGMNEYNQPIFFNVKMKEKQKNRNSSNVVVVGTTGSGKSWNITKQLNWLYLNNTKILIIDPEQEYHKLCNYYKGEIISIGENDNSSVINPLEIFTINLMEHISFIEQFFKILYKDLGDIDLAKLQKLCLKVYKNFNITDKTDLTKLKTKDYPTLIDLYNEQNKSEIKVKNKSTLHSVLWKLAIGADGNLWNKHTTLDLNHKFIVFDTHNLSNNTNKYNAQLLLMIVYIEQLMKENKKNNSLLSDNQNKEFICLAIDEAHLLINENNALALSFVVGLVKRMRKYYGVLYIITQNINDFTGRGNSKIKSQAEAILNNSLYQFVHQLAPSDLQDYDNLISASGRLNEYQKNAITNASIGTCLFSINNNKSIVNVNINDFEVETIMKEVNS